MAKISSAPRRNIQHKKLHHNNVYESDFNQYSTKNQQRKSWLVQGTSRIRHQILLKQNWLCDSNKMKQLHENWMQLIYQQTGHDTKRVKQNWKDVVHWNWYSQTQCFTVNLIFIPQCCQTTMRSRLLDTNSSSLGLVQQLRNITGITNSK